MQDRDAQANTFYKLVLFPNEEPGFVSDEANLCDITLAPDEEIIQKIQQHYGVVLHSEDFQRPFWSLLDTLNEKLGSADH